LPEEIRIELIMLRLGVDIGGTFTDVVLLDEQRSRVFGYKEPTTPDNFIDGALRGIRGLLERHGIAAGEIGLVAHGATIATNAVIERTGPKIGLLTTKGFRDILEQGRGARPAELIYDIRRPRADPLVPRRYRIGITERIDSEGNEVVSLFESDVIDALKFLRSEGIASIAVCFLFAYRNTAHEKEVKRIAAEVYPEAHIHLSSEIHPEIREYERLSITVLNAYVGPVVTKYLSTFDNGLRSLGIERELYVMQSNGGLSTSRVASERPISTFFSGPAGGVIASKFIAAQLGIADAVMTDMGGTSFEVAIIHKGEPQLTTEKEIGGYPLNTTSLDINTVGAGGGSIAWVDEVGGLKVGPRSASARPGPACYGLGGKDPTTTDANLVLGRLGADSLLGGRFKISPELARTAIEERVAKPLGMSVEAAAQGIVTILNAKMSGAIRALTVKRGFDVREFALIVYGGAGPLHAVDLANELHIPWVIVPPDPGTTSALGLTLPDVAHDYVRTYLSDLRGADPVKVEKVFVELEESGHRDVTTARTDVQGVVFRRSMDLKYANQTFMLTINVDEQLFSSETPQAIRERFHRLHESIYGLRFAEEPIEIVNLRVSVIGKLKTLQEDRAAAKIRIAGDSVKGRRGAYFFAPNEGFVNCPVHDYERLNIGAIIEGPAIVEQENSTIVIPPARLAKLDAHYNLVIGDQEWRR
jgi:N-methylhydantoinase A